MRSFVHIVVHGQTRQCKPFITLLKGIIKSHFNGTTWQKQRQTKSLSNH